jgi:hypothetical protein
MALGDLSKSFSNHSPSDFSEINPIPDLCLKYQFYLHICPVFGSGGVFPIGIRILFGGCLWEQDP